MTNGAFQVDGLWLDVVWRRALAHPSPAVGLAPVYCPALNRCCGLGMLVLQHRASYLSSQPGLPFVASLHF